MVNNETRKKLSKMKGEYWLVNYKTDDIFPAKTVCCGPISKEEVEEVKRKILLNQCVLQAYERKVDEEVYILYQQLKDLQERKNILIKTVDVIDPEFKLIARMIDKKYHLVEELVRKKDKECEPVILISA